MYVKVPRAYHLRRYPPLGILYVSASLSRAGHDTSIFDMTLESMDPEALAAHVSDHDYLFVGFYVDMATKQTAAQYWEAIRATCDTAIVAGGPSSCNAEGLLEAGADFVCVGEADRSVVRLAEHLAGDAPLSTLRGIAYREGQQNVQTEPEDLVGDLDELPFPDRTKLPATQYYDRYSFCAREPFTTMLTSRGCPMKCVYCSSPQFWRRQVRRRSVENTLAELRQVQERHGTRYVDFVDDMFTLDEDWVREFCSALLDEQIRVGWSCLSGPRGLDLDLLRLMKRAGCDTLKIGLQSASPDVLKACKRPTGSPQHAERLIANARAAGLITFLDFIHGLPADTAESLDANVAFAVRTNPTFAKFYKLEFLEGSELFAKRDEKIHQLCDEEIAESVTRAWRRFYLRPIKALGILWLLLKNPRRLRSFFRYLRLLLMV